MLSTTTERRHSTLRRSVISLAGLGAAALTAGSLALAPAAWAETTAPAASAPDTAPTQTLTAEQALNASIEPSVVQLYIEWTGYVAFPTDEGTTWSDELTVASICTGFFVSETGQIATAGHCVDPVEGRHALIDQFLGDMAAQGWLLPEEAAGLAGTAYANWAVEGLDAGSEPGRIIYAVQPNAVEGIAIEDPLAVQLVDYRSFDQGDVALLKADVTGTVPLPVTATDPTSGTAVTSVGFPGSVQSVVDASRVRASFKTGSVSSQQISEQGVPRTEINADLSGGMSGGPTVDSLGNVVGVNSSKINGDQAFNFITDASDLHGWLTARGVTLAETHVPAAAPTEEPVAAEVPAGAADTLDSDEEAALAIGMIVAVGAAVLGGFVTVALVVVLVVRSRRRGAARRGATTPPAPASGAGPAMAFPAGVPTQSPAAEAQHLSVVESMGSVTFASGAPAAAPGQVSPQERPMAPIGVATGFTASGTGTMPAPVPAGFGAAVLTAPAASAAASATCRACGAPAGDGQRFCGSCGGQL